MRGFDVVFSGLIRKGGTTWMATFKQVVTKDHRFEREVVNLSQLDNAFLIDFYRNLYTNTVSLMTKCTISLRLKSLNFTLIALLSTD